MLKKIKFSPFLFNYIRNIYLFFVNKNLVIFNIKYIIFSLLHKLFKGNNNKFYLYK